jgi:peptidoglycan/xylan/chitin deacetylase (PgdA/CDA1 family)
MMFIRTAIIALVVALAASFPAAAALPASAKPASATTVPILLYHRFGPIIADSMTVTTADFAASLEYLRDNGYHVIPLRQLVDFQLGQAPAPPPRSVVITIDDGHRSVYTEAFPLLQKFQVPVTLFIYPSAISNAAYALTWEQLREMKKSGLVDCQSHTFWHPNFKQEKKRLAPAEYDTFVNLQFKKSQAKLEHELGGTIDLLAWPFGIYNDDLVDKAAAAGYKAAFTMDGRSAGAKGNIMTLPRYLISGAKADRQMQGILAPRN